MANNRHVVQRIVEPERKSDHEQGRADFYLFTAGQVRRSKRSVNQSPWQSAPIDFNNRYVNLASTVCALTPDALAIAV